VKDGTRFALQTIGSPLLGVIFGAVLNSVLKWTASGVAFPPVPPLLFAVFKFGSIVFLALFGFIFAAMLFLSTNPPSRLKSHLRLFSFIKGTSITLLAFVVLVGGSVIFVYMPSSVISISYPTQDSKVPQNVIVYGTANYVPPGQSLWLVLYNPQLRLYYPQDHAVTIPPNGNWSGQMYIGGANDTGKQFTISAVLADNGAFASYIRNGETTGNWPGIIPENYTSIVNTYDQVTVTRA
jgi:hypothetical protein